MSDRQDLDVFACPLDGIRLIEASAGTGKTWNICGLALRLLLERALPVQQLLVVTFTNAATAELAERIRARIADVLRWLASGREEADRFPSRLVAAVEANAGLDRATLAARLEAALAAFDEASIFTIHAFCQRALGDAAFSAGEPFEQELAPEDAEFVAATAADFWRREVAGGSLPPALVDILLARGDTPEAWGALVKQVLAKPLAELRWPAEDGADTLADAADTLNRSFAAARSAWNAEPETPEALILRHLERLNATSYKADSVATGAHNWRAWLAAGPAGCTGEPDKLKLHLYTPDKLKPKKGQAPLPEHPFFAAAEALIAALATYQGFATRSRLALLRRLLEGARADLARRKREARALAFDDMLNRLWEALDDTTQPWLAETLRTRFPAALIDEFQDTDPVQFAIFQRLYEDAGSLFLVGDPKQAIYRFRNADLHTYLAARDQAAATYTLRHNQRSTAPLIAACNAVFSANPGVFLLEDLDYERVAEGDKPKPELRDDSDGARAALCVWLLPADGEAAEDHRPRSEALNLAADATAGEIARLLAAGQAGTIAIDDEPLQPRHLAVLVRSHREARIAKAALAKLGVGAVELSQASVFHSLQAEELAAVLTALREPGRRPVLLAALATTLMGFDAAALTDLGADDARLLALMNAFDALRQRWLQRGIAVALRLWQREFGISARLLALPEGERMLTNLLHLFELLQQAAAEHPQPEALLRWFNRQRQEASPGEEAQLRLESDRNLVSIVTIHRSKGLEYPFVFCPFLFDGHTRNGGGGEMLEYHEGDHLVLDFDPARRDDEDLKAQRQQEDAAETLRLYYVALTRAVLRCYIVGGLYAGSSFGKPNLSDAGRSLLNWMVAGKTVGDYAAWRKHKPDAGAIGAAWEALADTADTEAPDALALLAFPDTAAALHLPPESHPALAALPPPAHIPEGWRIGSFTGLMRGAGETAPEDASAADHDALAALGTPAPRAPRPAELPANDILDYPKGAAAGTTLHAAFEHADFSDPASWPGAVEGALRETPLPGGTDQPREGERLLGMLRDVLATEVLPGLQLRDIPAAQRQTELGFTLPAGLLRDAQLNRWLAAHGYALPALAFGQIEGFLTGFIDLVFQHQGRYYLLDWKSNHLGYQPADYAPAPLAEAMNEHGYPLQALIYTLALHRLLARRLPDYDYARDFGGALYLFVRGVRPGWQAPDGRPAGVVHLHPAPEEIAELEAMLERVGV